jgi:hypothetical protein
MTIVFKNLARVKVMKEVTDILNKKITDGDCKKFQTFSDETGTLICAINVDDISFIYDEDKIAVATLHTGQSNAV